MKPERFTTHYFHQTGVLMVLAESYFVLIRMSDGLCESFEYSLFEKKVDLL